MVESAVHFSADWLSEVAERTLHANAFLARLRFEYSVRPDLCETLEGEVVRPDDPEGYPVYRPAVISDLDSSNEELEGNRTLIDDRSPVPPPPSYPGTPDSSSDEGEADDEGSDALWDEISEPSTELMADPLMEGPQLRAMRVLGPGPLIGPLHLPTLDDDEPIMVPESDFVIDGKGDPVASVMLVELIERTARAEAERAAYAEKWESLSISERRRAMTRPDPTHLNAELHGDHNGDTTEDGQLDSWDRHIRPSACALNSAAIASGYPPVQWSSSNDGDSEDLPLNTDQYPPANQFRPVPEPRPDDACILRSLVMLSDSVAEHYLTYVDHRGTLYVKAQPLPDNHYLNPDFRRAHEASLSLAIRERAAELNVRAQTTLPTITWAEEAPPPFHDRHGFLDTEPHRLPGEAVHNHLAPRDPENDLYADPGSRLDAHRSENYLTETAELPTPKPGARGLVPMTPLVQLLSTPPYCGTPNHS
ncbi:hypothetical protein B0H15DRAFT_807347 [Mycena belliarum]|uniref:Uncharacterized protein n=1 Tax=Mycena belliarum TaxID=1033014 RepID=A0AAD6TNP8_9AGAR|nr:hypothetical protein B0H15DRAFT_807347 [Mycena belliae]